MSDETIDPKVRAALQEMDRSKYGDPELPFRMRDLLGWPYRQTPMNAAYEYVYPPTPDELSEAPHE